MADPARVAVILPTGERGTIPAAKVDEYRTKYGVVPVSQETLAEEARQAYNQEHLGGLTGKVIGGGITALDIPTFGGASYALTREPVARALGAKGAEGVTPGQQVANILQGSKEANPTVAGAGLIAGMAMDPFAALGEAKSALTGGLRIAKGAPEGLKAVEAWRAGEAAKNLAGDAKLVTPKTEAVASGLKGSPGDYDALLKARLAQAREAQFFGESAEPAAGQTASTNVGGKPSPVATAMEDTTNVGGRPNQAVVPPPAVAAEATKTLADLERNFGIGTGLERSANTLPGLGARPAGLGPMRTKFDLAGMRAAVEAEEPTAVTMTGQTGKIDLLAPRAPLPPLRTRLGNFDSIRKGLDETGQMTAYEGPVEQTTTGSMSAYEPYGPKFAGPISGENTAARAASLQARIRADLGRDQVGVAAIRDLNRAALDGDPSAVATIRKLIGQTGDPMSAIEAGAQKMFGAGGDTKAGIGYGGLGADPYVDSLTGVRPSGTQTFQEAQRLGDTIADATQATKARSAYGQQVIDHPATTPTQAFVQGAATAHAPGLEAVGAEQAAKLEQGLMLHPETAKGLRELAGNMAIAGMYGAGNSLSEQSLHDPAHISGQKILYGALMGGGIGLFANLGIKALSGMGRDVAAVASGQGEGVIGAGLAKYLREAEAGAGIRSLLGKGGVSVKDIETLGGAEAFWRTAKKLYGINTADIAANANFASQKFATRAEAVLADAQARHNALLGEMDRFGNQPMASDVIKAYQDQAKIVDQNPLRRADLNALQQNSKAVAENLGVVWDANLGMVHDRPLSFKELADQISYLEGATRDASVAQGSIGEARLAIRDDLQKIMDAKAHEALAGSGGKLSNEYARSRLELEVAKKVHESIQRAGNEMYAGQGITHGAMDGILKGVGSSVLGAGVAFAAGGHVAAGWLLGNVVARVGKQVWNHYGAAISTAFFGKAAQLAAIDTGAQIASARLGARVQSALEGKLTNVAPKEFNHEATVAAIDSLAEMTPDEITRRGAELGKLIAEDAPETAATVSMVAVNTLGYLRSNLPKPMPIPFQSAHEPAVYAREDLVRCSDRLEVCNNPDVLCDRIADGTVTKEQAQAVRDTHEVFYEQTRKAVADYIMQLNVPYQQRYRLGWVFDIPADPFLDPGMVIEVDNARQTVQVKQQEEKQTPKPGSLRMPFKPNQIMPPPTSATLGGNEP